MGLIRTKNWTDYVRQIVICASHGYQEFFQVVLPEAKANRSEHVIRRLLATYPEVELDYNRRYRRKKRGEANMALVWWDHRGCVLRTQGAWTARPNEDVLVHIDAVPLLVPVGERITIRIGKARAGHKYTAYLARPSYRWIRGMLQENLSHRRTAAVAEEWERAMKLPGFAGIYAQMRDLHTFLRSEERRHGVKLRLPPPRLRPAYLSSRRDAA